jgi:tRNA (guanine9-N1)-methyltransferase
MMTSVNTNDEALNSDNNPKDSQIGQVEVTISTVKNNEDEGGEGGEREEEETANNEQPPQSQSQLQPQLQPQLQSASPLSKNQMKKRRRYEKLMAIKKRKKQQDKEAKAAKAKAQGRDLEQERKFQAEREKSGEGHLKREKKWLQRLENAESSFKICVDCSFGEMMSKKEIGSLSNQIRYCYAANKRSDHPVYLSISSLAGETYDNLKRVEGFPDNWRVRAFDCSDKSLTELHAKTDLVYLTSDSTNTLTKLDNSKVYVIGGIVDRNRLKGATINKANELGVETARLPIDEHLKLCATKVLTCNHVFEILLKFKEHRDWKKALLDVLPARKDVSTKVLSLEDAIGNNEQKS